MEQTVWKIQADLNYQAFTSALFSDTSDTSLADLPPLPRKSEPTPAAPFATMLMTKRNLSAPTTLKLPSSPPSNIVHACWPTVIQQFSMAICIATLPALPAC